MLEILTARWPFFFLHTVSRAHTAQHGLTQFLTLDKMATPLYQSPVQPLTGENDAANNIITALVHISLN